MKDYGTSNVNVYNPNGQAAKLRPVLTSQRIAEIHSEIRRHNIAILYLVAELRNGEKPEKITIGGESD